MTPWAPRGVKRKGVFMRKIISNFRKSKAAKIIEVPAEQPEYGRLEQPFPGAISSYLKSMGISLYSHQTEVVEKARDGKNIVLATSTASGKTIAFTLPVLEELLESDTSTAMFLYPMKALAYDQLKNFQEIERETAIELHPAVYDGDTPRHLRRNIREISRIILTNPYALHYYLPWHHIWVRFFANLKYLIVDEAHWYRGIFGTNVAFLLRRFLRILSYYGSDPQIIIASATMADPLEHANKLTSKKFELVDKDGSGKGKKTYVFWDTAKNIDSSQHVQTADLVAGCVENNLQTLCFASSRKLAELTAMWSSEKTSRKIVSYRAGYLPEERRDIERRLKSGEIAGVVSTNALELGINIGGLDAVIIGGYPGTVSSYHQRAGRAGRSGQDSLVIQSVYDNPLDAYLLARPSYLFEAPCEQAVISLGNRRIVKAHIMCAAEELPLKKKDEKWFGSEYVSCVRELSLEGKVRPRAGCRLGKDSTASQYVYSGKGACFKVQLSDISASTFELVCRGEVLEKLDQRQAFTEAHPGAVYLHRGQPYEVIDFDLNNKKITLQLHIKGTFTFPLSDTEVEVKEVLRKREIGNSTLYFGNVRVTETVYGYSERNKIKVLGERPLPFSLTTVLETQAVWLNFDGSIPIFDGAVHAAEHVLIGVTPLLAMCDRWDIGGLAYPDKLFIYEGFDGGIGIAERLFSQYKLLINKGMELLEECSCDDGCPRCIISPKCGSGNEPLSKNGAIILLKQIMG